MTTGAQFGLEFPLREAFCESVALVESMAALGMGTGRILAGGGAVVNIKQWVIFPAPPSPA